MPLYDAVKDLTLTIERLELEPHVLPLKHITRRTTVVHLRGGGTEGVGRSATGAVVLASLFVIVADVLLVRLILIFFR